MPVATIVPALKHNFVAAVAPTTANNSSQGYSAGSLWVIQDPGNERAWQYVGEDAGDAVWRELTARVSASAGPVATDDVSKGFHPGSVWVHTGVGVWFCGVADVGAAVWLPVPILGNATLPASGAGSGGVSTTGAARVDHVHAATATVSAPKTSAYTLAVADSGQVITIDSAAGVFDLDLPDPATLPVGWWVRIVDVGGALTSNPVTLDRFGAESISGVAADFLLRADFGEWVLRRNGTNWLVRGRNRCRQVFTSSGPLVVPAGVKVLDLIGRPGAGGGGGGGGGGAGSVGDVGGGGGGRVAGGGGGAVRIHVRGLVVTPGESLDVVIGAGGTGGGGGAAGGAGTSGATGGHTRIDRAATTLVRWSSSSISAGGGQGSGGGSAGNVGTATGGIGQSALSAGAGYHSDFTGNGGPGAASGGGGTGNQAGTGGANAQSANTGGLLVHNSANKAGGAASAGGGTDGTFGGGGGGAGGGYGGGGDDYGAFGEAAATAADGAGGGGGAGGTVVGGVGGNGAAGGNGTNGVAGRGGGAGGGGGGGSASAGVGGAGGNGGNGSDGILVAEWWG